VLVTMVAGASVGTYLRGQQSSSLTSPNDLSPLPPLAADRDRSVRDNFITSAVETSGGAVVKVDAIATTVSNSATPAAEIGPKNSGTGSGFIISADGNILTNAHLLAGAKSAKVTLTGGRVLTGKIIGIDRVTDVAVLRVSAQNLPTVKLGKSARLVQGEWTIAIGNPLGLDNTVTVGIVSATERSSTQAGIANKRVRFIQTDAAINPGNSGGPLLNARGEVIGMNTIARTQAQGLGFAIPIDTAMRITRELLATGRVRHPYLGVQMIPITAELRSGIVKDPELRSKITAKQGALVMEVVPRSPAQVGGILPGDAIVKVGNRSISTPEDVQQEVAASKIGRNLKVTLSRAGRVRSVEIKPDVYPTIED
jgi:S1-C subfamily serine protease